LRSGAYHWFVTAKNVAQLVPCAQQEYADERSSNAKRIGNFFVTHIQVIAKDERHARPRWQFIERRADFFAAVLFKQPLELAWVGMLERQILYLAGFKVLADATPPE
jgi:hypothetical protein